MGPQDKSNCRYGESCTEHDVDFQTGYLSANVSLRMTRSQSSKVVEVVCDEGSNKFRAETANFSERKGENVTATTRVTRSQVPKVSCSKVNGNFEKSFEYHPVFNSSPCPAAARVTRSRMLKTKTSNGFNTDVRNLHSSNSDSPSLCLPINTRATRSHMLKPTTGNKNGNELKQCSNSRKAHLFHNARNLHSSNSESLSACSPTNTRASRSHTIKATANNEVRKSFECSDSQSLHFLPSTRITRSCMLKTTVSNGDSNELDQCSGSWDAHLSVLNRVSRSHASKITPHNEGNKPYINARKSSDQCPDPRSVLCSATSIVTRSRMLKASISNELNLGSKKSFKQCPDSWSAHLSVPNRISKLGMLKTTICNKGSNEFDTNTRKSDCCPDSESAHFSATTLVTTPHMLKAIVNKEDNNKVDAGNASEPSDSQNECLLTTTRAPRMLNIPACKESDANACKYLNQQPKCGSTRFSDTTIFTRSHTLRATANNDLNAVSKSSAPCPRSRSSCISPTTRVTQSCVTEAGPSNDGSNVCGVNIYFDQPSCSQLATNRTTRSHKAAAGNSDELGTEKSFYQSSGSQNAYLLPTATVSQPHMLKGTSFNESSDELDADVIVSDNHDLDLQNIHLPTTTRATRSQTLKAKVSFEQDRNELCVNAGKSSDQCSSSQNAYLLVNPRVTRSQALKAAAGSEGGCKRDLEKGKKREYSNAPVTEYFCNKKKRKGRRRQKCSSDIPNHIQDCDELLTEPDILEEPCEPVTAVLPRMPELRISDVPPKSHHAVISQSQNFIDNLSLSLRGLKTSVTSKVGIKDVLINNIKSLEPFTHLMPYKSIVTAMNWHPTYTHLLSVASERGDILLWNTRRNFHEEEVCKINLGASISSMRFHKDKPLRVYVVLMTGKILFQNLENRRNTNLLDGINWNKSFTSLDVSLKKNILIAGDNSGYACLASLDGEQVTKRVRLHKSKVTHVEFSTKDDCLVATSSTDNTVKLWDLRKLSNGSKRFHCLTRLDHSKSVNSACFSIANGSSLLTTGLDDDVKVYIGPLWHLETIISRPHHHLHHRMPIKANWHPLQDIIVMGRYPQDGFGSIDGLGIGFYDGHTGNLMHQYLPPSISGIVPYNSFNPTGEFLASGAGCRLVLWKSDK